MLGVDASTSSAHERLRLLLKRHADHEGVRLLIQESFTFSYELAILNHHLWEILRKRPGGRLRLAALASLIVLRSTLEDLLAFPGDRLSTFCIEGPRVPEKFELASDVIGCTRDFVDSLNPKHKDNHASI